MDRGDGLRHCLLGHDRQSSPAGLALQRGSGGFDEGVRMMSRVEGVEPAAIEIGMRVKARIAAENGTPIILFGSLDA
jgi:hypothetical protein